MTAQHVNVLNDTIIHFKIVNLMLWNFPSLKKKSPGSSVS